MNRVLRDRPLPRATTDCAFPRVESRLASSQLRQLKADPSIITAIQHHGHLAFMPARVATE